MARARPELRPRSSRPVRGQRDGQVQRLDGIHPVSEAIRAGRRRLRRLRIRPGPWSPELEAIAAAARAAGVPVDETAESELQALVGPGNPQGVVLEADPLPELSLADLAGAPEAGSPRTWLALDGVEDPQNLGAIARVAEGAGASALVLTRRHAPPLSPAVARASAGAIEWLPVARVPNLVRALNDSKSLGFWIFGCEPEGATDLFDLPDRLTGGDRVVVLGAEGRGLRPGVAGAVDHRISIPMRGRVGSLNVSTAAAVVLYELVRRERAPGLATPPRIP